MKNLTLDQFTKDTASDSPVPGGGSIAAVCGALSASLTSMVANLTIGKKNYVEVENEMIIIAEKAEGIRQKMLDYIETDCDAFNAVLDAFKLPKETDEEKSNRTEAIQDALKKAASVPFEIATAAYEIMDLAEHVVLKGNSNAVTDGIISAMTARTAVLAALLNVKINLGTIKDEAFVEDLRKRVSELENDSINAEKKILDLISF
ncbi:MAG: Formiminotetrahydrofolate cyclodeaminase [Clostridiales bacterium 38_11]|nr:MAG: Formiminotetrahydrofolate cyclodeaminase [Clostridiales bacterium 38_11]HBH13258.1 methenyltetrahydrofolate cyclohydrolase [Clostridiales bacterium]